MTFSFDDADIEAVIGTTGEARLHVSDADTATSLGSGDLPVLGTPRMVALMEQAACAALLAHLPPHMTTVGTHVDVRHGRRLPWVPTWSATRGSSA